MELQIQDLVSSIKKDGIDSANQQAAAILADARKRAGFDTVLLEGMQFHFTPAMLERRFDPEELAEYTRRLTAEQARQMDRALRRQCSRRISGCWRWPGRRAPRRQCPR